MKMFLRALAVVALAAGFGDSVARPVRADFAYGVTFLDNQLIAIDTSSGLGTLIGPVSSSMSFGLANVNNRLLTFDSSTSRIAQISAVDGSTVATFNVGLGPVLGQGGLAFQSSTVGFLTSALDPNTFDQANNLYRFDLSTGTSTLISHTAATLGAIAFGGTGTLYGLGKFDGNLYTLDPMTGAMKLVGNTGIFVGNPVESLSFGPSGGLFATINDSLYTLNAATGAATLVGSSPSNGIGFFSVSGLALSTTNLAIPSATVPEPKSIATFALGLVGLAGLAFTRRTPPRSLA